MTGTNSGVPHNSVALGDGDPMVVWTRGSGCSALARLLGGERIHKAEGDLRAACIQARADLLVTRSLSSFDLVDVAVPHHFSSERVRGVVATVGGGPHSTLAARIAAKVAESLGVPGRIVIASPSAADDARAERTLDGLRGDELAIPADVVRSATAEALVTSFAPGTLLVLGAPGGSWMQRQFFGPGRKLLFSASGGAVIVRSAPLRCFQVARPVAALGTQMGVRDALAIIDGRRIVPVAEDGQLVGIIRADSLNDRGPESTIGDVMEDPVFVHVDDPVEDSAQVSEFLGGGAVPVVDRDGVLFGEVAHRLNNRIED